MLIESLVMLRIHYWCSLYYWFPVTSTKSLDRIIRSPIRILNRVKLYDHESVNYHLVNSKWLNIYRRSTFSYYKLIFKVITRYGKRYLGVAAADILNALPVRLITSVNYSYFKYNVLLLICNN